ncbi:MAG: hypothetical protein SGARI_000069, partial [Bacillariaceae sp.]
MLVSNFGEINGVHKVEGFAMPLPEDYVEWILCSDDDIEDNGIEDHGMGTDIESNNEHNHETQDTALPFVNGISTFGEGNGSDFDDADLECKCDSTQLSNDHIRNMLHDTSDIVRKQIHPASWEGDQAEQQSAEKRGVEKQTTPSLTTSFLADEADRKGAYLHPRLRKLWEDSYWRALGNPCPFKRRESAIDSADEEPVDSADEEPADKHSSKEAPTVKDLDANSDGLVEEPGEPLMKELEELGESFKDSSSRQYSRTPDDWDTPDDSDTGSNDEDKGSPLIRDLEKDDTSIVAGDDLPSSPSDATQAINKKQRDDRIEEKRSSSGDMDMDGDHLIQDKPRKEGDQQLEEGDELVIRCNRNHCLHGISLEFDRLHELGERVVVRLSEEARDGSIAAGDYVMLRPKALRRRNHPAHKRNAASQSAATAFVQTVAIKSTAATNAGVEENSEKEMEVDRAATNLDGDESVGFLSPDDADMGHSVHVSQPSDSRPGAYKSKFVWNKEAAVFSKALKDAFDSGLLRIKERTTLASVLREELKCSRNCVTRRLQPGLQFFRRNLHRTPAQIRESEEILGRARDKFLKTQKEAYDDDKFIISFVHDPEDEQVPAGFHGGSRDGSASNLSGDESKEKSSRSRSVDEKEDSDDEEKEEEEQSFTAQGQPHRSSPSNVTAPDYEDINYKDLSTQEMDLQALKEDRAFSEEARRTKENGETSLGKKKRDKKKRDGQSEAREGDESNTAASEVKLTVGTCVFVDVPTVEDPDNDNDDHFETRKGVVLMESGGGDYLVGFEKGNPVWYDRDDTLNCAIHYRDELEEYKRAKGEKLAMKAVEKLRLAVQANDDNFESEEEMESDSDIEESFDDYRPPSVDPHDYELDDDELEADDL